MLARLNSFFKKYWYTILVFLIMSFGVILRLKGLLINPSLWHDECALAWNIKFKTYLGLFGDLRFMQIAPPLFLVATKALVNLLNVQNTVELCDLVMRIIPCICGCLSIGVFYLISKRLFQAKKTIILALTFFVINSYAISYSFEIKSYELDIFFSLLLVLFFIELDIQKISFKKLFLASFTIAISLWFSFVSIFFIAAGFIGLALKKEIYKRANIKKVFFLYLPFFISILIYLEIYLLGAYYDNGQGMINFWGNQFILPNFSNFLYLLVENIKYLFFPIKFVLFILILSAYGYFTFFKEKKYEFISLISLVFAFLVIASILHIYPFSRRLVLFLIPLFILLFSKPLDSVSLRNKIKSFFILLMLFFLLIPQVLFVVNNLAKRVNKGEFPREMMDYIVKNLRPSDRIFLNKASNTEFYYYSSFYNFKNEVIKDNLGDTSDKQYQSFLANLPKGYYWLFLPYDYSPNRVMINYIINWVFNKTEVRYSTEATQSVLMYIYVK